MFFDEIEYIASPCQYTQLRLSIGIEYMSEPIKLFYNGEFDPGSGRTLAAGLTHASRTRSYLRVVESGARVSNA